MAPLQLLFIFALQFEAGISGMLIYRRLGEGAVLPCATVSSYNPTCCNVSWLYSRDPSQTLTEVERGNVRESSGRAARLRVDTSCSLVINNVTAEDVGLYTCRQGTAFNRDVYLIVLAISPSPPDADPKREGEVTLKCSLWRHSDLRPCRLNSIRWLDETGSELHGDGDGYRFLGQRRCVSTLIVKRQSGHNRKYTCRFIDINNKIAIEADYTLDFTDGITRNETETSNPDPTGWSPLSFVMLTLRIAGLILMIVITTVVIRNTWNKKPLDSDNEDGDVQYENVEARRRPAAAAAAARLH